MATQAIQDRRRWLNHRHYRTYEIALGITRAVGWPADLRDLEFLAEGITGFLPPWQKETAVHRLARVVASDLFLRDTEGPYIQVFEETDGVPARMNRYLPVDVAMHAYGIDHGEMFRVPEPDGTEVRKGNTVTWAESERVANACYDYTLDLQWTEPYDLLLTHLSDEVFHTIFPNRVLLGRLHEVLAIYVRQQSPEFLSGEPDVARLFSREGCLKRVAPPLWARKAVFFRDQGHCATCGMNLGALIDPLPAGQFDHIVPLSLGGLNDVSNLQLLCQQCNRRKSSGVERPSARQRRYYERTRQL